MKLPAVVKNPLSIARYLAAAGELTDVPSRSPGAPDAPLGECEVEPAGARPSPPTCRAARSHAIGAFTY